jgi:hypothetical protein
MKITLQHARSMPNCVGGNGYCSRKMREFADRYGLDWEAFIKDGIDEEALLATDNAMAKKVVEFARAQDGQ